MSVDGLISATASQARLCPTCGRDDGRPLARYTSARLVRCQGCGLVFAGSLPSAAELGQHYAAYPAADDISELTARRYRELLESLGRYRRTGRLLDVGCGDGHFLAAARDHGWQSYGSEYGDGPRERATAKDLDVRPAPFPASASELGTFDVILMIEVIEHVTEPQEEVSRVADLLRSGGVLYLTTPNFNSLSRRVLRANWRAIEYPEHLNMFTPRTLDDLLTRTGLRRLSTATTGVSPTDLWAGLKPPDPTAAAAQPAAPSLDQRLRSGVDASSTVDRALRAANAILSRLGIGDTIKALYTYDRHV